jgi:hypothetical protein
LGEGKPPAKLMMPGFSVSLRISRIAEGFIFAVRLANNQGEAFVAIMSMQVPVM